VLMHDEKDTTLSLTEGQSLSISFRHKGVIFAVKPSLTLLKANILKRFFKISVYLLNLRLLNFHISLGSVLNIT